ncbi:hypothetical protein [Catenovulum sediminis]|uniref:Uncharacterized protein n=1 Tax=Catenovulum sediminis TaxID=1740262 RepID=A0ABV1RI34_9ALTE
MTDSTWNPESFYQAPEGYQVPQYTGPSSDGFQVPNAPNTNNNGIDSPVSELDMKNFDYNKQLQYEPKQINESDEQFYSKTMGELQKAEYGDYKARFRGFDGKLVSLVDNTEMLDKQLGRISASAQSAQASQAKSQALRNSRLGISPSALQMQSQSRQSQLSAGLGIAQAKNNMRVATSDLQDSILTGASGRSVLSEQAKQGG